VATLLVAAALLVVEVLEVAEAAGRFPPPFQRAAAGA
jgi:hypothetical protein